MIIKKREMENMSNHTGSGSPNGNEKFIEKKKCKLDWMFKLRPRGMLDKEPSQQMGYFLNNYNNDYSTPKDLAI